MCGIAGVVGDADTGRAELTVSRMVAELRRRGPDDEGVELWGRAVLGHRRLSIFDLTAAGHQPMLSPDRTIGVVFNGAIYNFRELRQELVARGYTFRSSTDTEVLIHGYREWGLDRLVDRLRGMFAFALWDDDREILFLVRDRLGVKPLLYVHRDGVLSFASTARALRQGGCVEGIDPHAVAEFLEWGYVTDDRCIYTGARKVSASSIVEWEAGQLRERTYWTPPAAGTERVDFIDAVDTTEAMLLQAVERRLQADVPVGALLSGGVDSGLVCWAISRLGGDVTAFTVGTTGDPWDETMDAVATASALGIRHEVVELSSSDPPAVDELTSAYGEPFACASALGMLRVSRAVAPSAKVLLTGDGGDDVFLGYPQHRFLWTAERAARVTPAWAARQWYTFRNNVPDAGALRRAKHYLDYVTGGLGAFISANDGLPTYRRYDLLGDRLAQATVDQRSTPWSIHSGRNVLSEYLEYDRRTQFVAEYMTKIDGATMYHGIEARSPFLDQDLWEYVSGLPFGVRLNGFRLKSVLRELARRRIGERIARGRKRGFRIPVQRWIVGRWRPALEDMLRESVLAADGWIRSESALQCLELASRERIAPQQLWYIFVLECWMRAEQGVATDESRRVTADAALGNR